MKKKKDRKNSNFIFDRAIEEQILQGLSSGLKKSQNTPYTLTNQATSDFKTIFNLTVDKEGFERGCTTLSTWQRVFLFLSQHPDFGKDASHYTPGLRSHFIGGINKRIYYIAGQEGEIIVVRIISVALAKHVQKVIDKYSR